MVIEVHDSNGDLVASRGVELVIHQELAASVPQTAYEVDVGGDLTIEPTVSGVFDPEAVQWGVASQSLPSWLDLDAATGKIEVDTSPLRPSMALHSLRSIKQTSRARAQLSSPSR